MAAPDPCYIPPGLKENWNALQAQHNSKGIVAIGEITGDVLGWGIVIEDAHEQAMEAMNKKKIKENVRTFRLFLDSPRATSDLCLYDQSAFL